MTSPVPFDHSIIPFEAPFAPIGLKDNGSAAGSCFADRVFGELQRSKVIRGMRNPNGIAYNPYSLQEGLRHLECPYTRTDLFEFDGMFHSWSHHGYFSDANPEQALSKMETFRKDFRKALRKSSFFMLTLSSAYVYIHTKSNRITSNCHRVPACEFQRELLSHETCRASIVSALKCVREYAPECKLIVTVSPILHDPGDLRKNSISKGRLISAAHDALEGFDNACYFPAYEIMNFELRSYRYYTEDLIHPNDTATKIIFNRFLETCFTPEAAAAYEAFLKQEKANAHIERKG